MTRSAFVLALVAAPAPAQYFLPYDLAISSDASQIYFISALRPAAGPASTNPYYIYKDSAGAVEPFHAILLSELPSYFGGAVASKLTVGPLAVSADGSMVSIGYSLWYEQNFNGTGLGTIYSGELFTNSVETTYSQMPILSRNGRFLYTCNPGCLLHDSLQDTSQSLSFPAVSVANNGTVLGVYGIFTQQNGYESSSQLVPSLSAWPSALDPTGSYLYMYSYAANSAILGYIVGIASGNVTALPVGLQFLQFSDSGSVVALYGYDETSTRQVFLINSDGSNFHQVTFEPAGISGAALNGDGTVVIAFDSYGSALRFDTSSGTRELLFETVPRTSLDLFKAASRDPW